MCEICFIRRKSESTESVADFVTTNIALCPVTLFLLGRYPERILIYKINKNHLHCPIFTE